MHKPYLFKSLVSIFKSQVSTSSNAHNLRSTRAGLRRSGIVKSFQRILGGWPQCLAVTTIRLAETKDYAIEDSLAAAVLVTYMRYFL